MSFSHPFSLGYGDAFLFVDEVISLDLELPAITTSKVYRSDVAMISAHTSATGPIVPGVLLIEQSAQSALILKNSLVSASNKKEEGAPRLCNVRANWIAAAHLDAPIEAKVELRSASDSIWIFEARLMDADRLVAKILGSVIVT